MIIQNVFAKKLETRKKFRQKKHFNQKHVKDQKLNLWFSQKEPLIDDIFLEVIKIKKNLIMNKEKEEKLFILFTHYQKSMDTIQEITSSLENQYKLAR